MRKVTASAVILTALTGCSQSSSIPSTQWSFEVPADEMAREMASEMASADASKGTLVSTELVASASSAGTPSSLAEVAENGQKLGRDRLMGPAFEQPEVDLLSGAKLSTVGRPGSKEVSSLTGETYGLASGLASTPPSTRPDPVAQVRAYLRSSGSPSALTNRTPYTSQVYLSSLPVPNQYDTPTVSVAASPSALDSPDFGPTDSLASISSLTDMDASIGTNEIASSPEAIFSTPILAPDLPPARSSDGLEATGYSSDTAALAERVEFENGLPQLVSSAPSGASASMPEVSSISEVGTAPELPAEDMSAGDMPIGTSILNNLQRSSAETATYDTAAGSYQPVPPVQTMPALANSAPPSPLSEVAPSQEVAASQIERSSSHTSLSATFSEPASGTVINELPDVATLAVADHASSQSASSQRATLASLTETMPSRDLSPLVASYRAAKNLAPLSGESSADYPPIQQPAVQKPVIQPSDTSLNTDVLSSPLLQSFSGDADVSTLYVPIAETAPNDISGTLIQEAIGALEAEVSTSDFLNELLEQGTFSSVLSSATLASASSSQTDLAPVTPSVDATVPSVAQRIPLSAKKQPSKRRQRVMWL